MPIEGGLPVDLAEDVFMGHEFSAEVLEAGPDTDAPPPGTLVTSLPVLLSPKGFEPILSSNTTDRRLCRANAAVGTAAAEDPQRPRPASRVAHRADGGRPARGEQVVDPAGRVGPRHRVLARSVSRSSPRCAIGAWNSIVAADYSHKRRELATTMGAHQVVDPGAGITVRRCRSRRWCSRPLACPESSTT